MLAATTYDYSLALHITAVVVGFGATFAESVTFPIAMKLDRVHLPYVHRLQRVINTYFAVPALVIVVATGFYQVSERDWDLGKPWLSISLGLVALIAVLNIAYFIPEDRRLEAMITRDLAAGEPSEEYMKRSRNTGIAGALTGVMLIAIIFLMVTKP
ncbi:MAG: hypothetical protein QOG41_1473 [Thermoleophilaceae bacterium]|nr:hypothetical protein [Thermoleophilaceae bacterium]MEA2388700.1 hypothetical protein [Thermoleophilaceae bacterium]